MNYDQSSLTEFRERTASGDWTALNSVSECLVRLGRGAEAIEPKDEWFRCWLKDPSTRNMREQQAAAIARGIPSILIIAMPKSGSTFTKLAFEEALRIPSCLPVTVQRPEHPLLPSGIAWLARGGAVARVHSLPTKHNLELLKSSSIKRAIILQRDPMAAASSWARAWAKYDDEAFAYAAPLILDGLPINFRSWQPPAQLDWAFEHIAPSMVAWSEAWEPYKGDPFFGFVHYDELKQNEEAYLDRCGEIVGLQPGTIRPTTPRNQMPNWGGAQSVR